MHRHIRRSKSVLKQSDKQYGLAEDLNDQVNQSDRAVEKIMKSLQNIILLAILGKSMQENPKVAMKDDVWKGSHTWEGRGLILNFFLWA